MMHPIEIIAKDMQQCGNRWVTSNASPSSLSEQALEKMGKAYIKRLGKLQAGAGKPRDVIVELMQAIALSHASQVFAVIRACDGNLVLTEEDVLGMAKGLSLDKFYHEKVRVRPDKSKTKSGIPRMLALSGYKRKAQQIILRDLLSVLYGNDAHDGTVKGNGGERHTIQRIKDSIHNSELEHWVSLDIKNFFPSLRPGHLKNLSVPARWIKKVIFLPEAAQLVFADEDHGIHFTVSDHDPSGDDGVEAFLSLYGQDAYSKLKKVRQGLLQGDAIAPQIARWFLGRELQLTLGELGVAWFSHMDDLAIGARTQAELVAAIEALKLRLKNHPAGPLETHGGKIKHVDDGFEFVHYYIRKDGQKVRVIPSFKRFGRFHERLWMRLQAVDEASNNAPSASDLWEAATSYCRQWFKSQTAWDKATNSLAYVLVDAEALVNLYEYHAFNEGSEYLEELIDFDQAEAQALQWPNLKLAG